MFSSKSSEGNQPGKPVEGASLLARITSWTVLNETLRLRDVIVLSMIPTSLRTSGELDSDTRKGHTLVGMDDGMHVIPEHFLCT